MINTSIAVDSVHDATDSDPARRVKRTSTVQSTTRKRWIRPRISRRRRRRGGGGEGAAVLDASRERIGHHGKGTPGVERVYSLFHAGSFYVSELIKCLTSDGSVILAML